MKKIRRIICVLLTITMVLTGLPFAVGTSAVETVSFAPVATQQQRMWCGTDYNTTDWVYEPWGYLGYGKVLYARFYNNTAASYADAYQYVIEFEALTKANEKTVYMAAVALSDEVAGAVESDVTSATGTRTVTSTAAGTAKLLTTTDGYFRDEVKNNVVAYTKATASNTAVSNPVSYSHGTYQYPVTIKLDVTDYVVEQFAAGKKNVQFALVSAHKILSGSTNVADLSGFDHYSNGKVYGAAGEILLQSDRLSLDTSIPVAGSANYYATTPTLDPYFSWMEVKRDTICMKMVGDEELFADFKAEVNSADVFAAKLGRVESLLSAEARRIYRNVVQDDPSLNTLLYNDLQNCATAADFADVFYQRVMEHRTITLSAVATQQQRMWCNDSYDSPDWVYEPWGYLGYGKILYARFYNDSLAETDMERKYVISFDALAKANEKTVYMAAVALDSAGAAAAESDVTSATSTRTYTNTNVADKLLTDRNGYYKDNVKNNVVAYTKATASDTAVSNPVSYSHGTYQYPVTIKLDVTDYVVEQFAAGKKNVQFALVSARQIMNAGTNVANLADFAYYANGKICTADEKVLAETERLSLDTSVTVSGSADYYSTAPVLDNYFSWLEVKRDTIGLEMTYVNHDEAFATYKAGVTSADNLAATLKNAAYMLYDGTYELYQKVAATNTSVNTALYDGLQTCATAEDFAILVYETLMNYRTLSLSAVATQQQRMWSGTNYNTTDWVYEPWGYLGYGKVFYARFYNNTAVTDGQKFVIELDALAKANEKTVYMAAVALSDEAANVVESDVTSATATRKVTSTAAGAGKLMTTSAGYYRDAVKNNVVAYTKATASDVAVSSGVTYAHGTYEYPVSFALDVTDYVKEQFAAGKKNVQFVLISARQVMSGDTNVAELPEFAYYANGKVFDTNGRVLLQSKKLSLDTSISVAGAQDYYSVTPANDPYFSWMEIKRDTIAMQFSPIGDEELFAAYKASVTDAASVGDGLDEVSALLGESYDLYKRVSLSNPGVNDALFAGLQECETAVEFVNMFRETVVGNCYGGYPCSITLDSGFAERRGSVTVTGDCPAAAYLYIKTTNNSGATLKTFAFPVEDGRGYYNIYGQDTGATGMSVTLTADAAGTRPLSATKSVTLSEAVLPGVFITELSNMHTNSYSADSSSSENQGSWTQCYQYIELHNYSDVDVDLSQMKFVYYNGSERTFDWILEDGGSLLLEAGESYVIGVYTGYSYYTNGHTYATSAARTQYWNDFQKYYNVTIPKTNRVMIACVNSGTSSYSSTAVLQRSKEAGVTCYAEIRNGSTTVAKVFLPDSKPHRGYAYQFVPDGTAATTEKLLFATGCFPYRMLKEQQLDYCEEVNFNVHNDINVLCYNILAEETYYTVGSRIPRLMDVLQTYQPDVIGFQEFNYSWANQLPSKMPKEYSVIEGISTYNHTFATASGTWDLLNPIYYRNDKYTVLESGSAFMTPDGNMNTQQWDSINMKRTMTWVVLKDKTSGEIFNVINAHLVLSGKTARIEQVKMIYNKGAALQEKYGGGIIAMGDHNMQEASEPYQAYINSGILVDAKYETVNHNSKDTAPAVNKYDGDYGVPIDFMMISPETVGVKEYKIFDGIYADGPVSDHSGMFVKLYSKGYEDNDAPAISGVAADTKYCGAATFKVSDANLRQVFLNGVAITVPAAGYTVTAPGKKTVTAVDIMGRETTLTFYTGTHTWAEEPTVVTSPSCKTAGIGQYHCTKCDAVNEEIIAEILVTHDHTEGETVYVDVEPTAQSVGYGHTRCTLCDRFVNRSIKIPALGIAAIGETAYQTLDEAMSVAKAGDTVVLNGNTEISHIVLLPGVTLDLKGNTLTAEYVVGMNTSALINSADNENGKLVVEKDHLSLSADNSYLPLYDAANGHYIFTRLKINRYELTTEDGRPRYNTAPMFKSYAHNLLDTEKEAAASGVDVIIRLSWTDADGQYAGFQDYVFFDSSINTVINSYTNTAAGVNYTKVFYGLFTGSEIENGVSVQVSTVVKSSTGVEMVSTATELFA